MNSCNRLTINRWEEILASFSQGNITKENEARISLTGRGAEIHSKRLSKQHLFRQRCMKDISESEYQTTLLTLKKLVTNLED